MHRLFLAALALACVCSPAMALGIAPDRINPIMDDPVMRLAGFGFGGLFLTLLIILVREFRDDMRTIGGLAFSALMGLMLILCTGAAFAAETATADTTRVTLSAAPWIELVREIVITAVIPAVAAYLIQAIRKVYPWAALFLTQARVEQMANAVTEYAINAVPGAVKEGKLSVNVGSHVIAKAVQRAVDAAPAKALEAAGGQAGLAEIVFRKLNLEDGANEDNTLAPVVASLPAAR
ncbi:hypothetical protein [Methylobacterium indicum]|uniref:hypothetical protein n=1 Tax=Methylobacterium indicum TaxID=1775910 RepID=UPI00069D7D98|nr:hypothetical protein [Methylobacterium indicum]